MFFRERSRFGGEFAKSWELTRRAVDSAQRANQKETAAEYQAHTAVREALAGNEAWQSKRHSLALAQVNGRQVLGFAAIALGLAGESAKALQLAGVLAKRFPARHDRSVRISCRAPCELALDRRAPAGMAKAGALGAHRST